VRFGLGQKILALGQKSVSHLLHAKLFFIGSKLQMLGHLILLLHQVRVLRHAMDRTSDAQTSLRATVTATLILIAPLASSVDTTTVDNIIHRQGGRIATSLDGTPRMIVVMLNFQHTPVTAVQSENAIEAGMPMARDNAYGTQHHLWAIIAWSLHVM
jgi:hypothetical protein